ncbi:cytochrome-c oxidase, cbb3-type subunit III [Sulfitobacter sp. SK012]|uniref:cytochrome-c oxidase, cbb3-type subunit III n=1 Tax=Sulfitobacter sp. SK012 TaxID=1389005 RepID=UPI000E0AACD4|nr:cytochrome-c oxidase, cbb3-type subunit III [Sulfitobacter sp. SK012]AXI45233.1 cytochrome-c oxidase, cbb3-type subunit III [Sulfitobacter sp. SK012]
MSDLKVDEETGVETTGHVWDGIEELNNPLPRWWLWTLYACIVWAIAYSIAYPAWPMLSGATSGVLGYSSRGEVAEDIAAHEAKNQGLVVEFAAVELAALDPASDLNRYAVARGGSVFRAQCSQCHGSGAAGGVGYPNLLDNDWLWGGDMDNITHSIRHGIRNDTDDDARYSEMPAFSEILETEEIDAIVEYVTSLSMPEFDAGMAEMGTVLFQDNCASCHGEKATGDRDLGAPNLADAIWLYGGDREALKYTVENARFGVMPAWGQRLTDADVRAVSVYVHSLGGGE